MRKGEGKRGDKKLLGQKYMQRTEERGGER